MPEVVCLTVERSEIKSEVELWHARIGHQGAEVLSHLSDEHNLDLFRDGVIGPSSHPKNCNVCKHANAKASPVSSKGDPQYKAKRPIETLHADLFGPITIVDKTKHPRQPSLGGKLYILVITDEFTRSVFVHLLAEKSESAGVIIDLIDGLEHKLGRDVRRFHTDNGGEFQNDTLRSFFKNKHIEHTTSSAGKSEHNGLAERMNQALQKMLRAFLVQAGAPAYLWGEAVLTAAYVHNSTPRRSTNWKAPFELLFNRRCRPRKFKVWGCNAFVRLQESKQSKVQPRAWRGVFVGYDPATGGYRILRPGTTTIYPTRDVDFTEHDFSHMRLLVSTNNGTSEPELCTLDPSPLLGEYGSTTTPASTHPDPNAVSDGDDEFYSNEQKMESTPVRPGQVFDFTDEDVPIDMESSEWEVGNDDADSSESIGPTEAAPSDSSSAPPLATVSVSSSAGSTSVMSHSNEEPSNRTQAKPRKRTEAEKLAKVFEKWKEPPAAIAATRSSRGRALRSRSAVANDLDNYADEDRIDALFRTNEKNEQPEFERKVKDNSRATNSATTPVAKQQQSLPASADPSVSDDSASPASTSSTAATIVDEDGSDEKVFFLHEDDEESASIFEAVPIQAEPTSFKAAMQSSDADAWEKAAREEYDSLVKLGVWELVELPAGAKAIRGKWVFKNKLGSNNELVRRKARYVAKGFQQVQGRDYHETHSPVSQIKSIKMVLSWTAHMDYELYQMDFDTAFLNADVDADIYMVQPEGFHKGGPRTVCKLKKAIYGLKQASRRWYKTINGFMLKLGFKPLVSDPCVYRKRSKTGKPIIISLYVDDTIIAVHKNDNAEWNEYKSKIAAEFATKDLGQCEWILNMKVTRDRKGKTLTLSQEAYIERVVKEFGLEETRTVLTPAAPIDLNNPVDGTSVKPLTLTDQELYQSIIGALLYAANITRVDIAFVVGQLCRFTSCPAQHHLHAARRVVRYLYQTKSHCLVFGSNPRDSFKLTAFSDSDWAGDKSTGKSTTGVIVKFNGDTISWMSRRQKVVAQSTAEAEYIALAEATKELMWYQNWIAEMFGKTVTGLVLGDNRSSIDIVRTESLSSRVRHIDIRTHFIRDEYDKGTIDLQWIPTDQQDADILTKPLAAPVFNPIRNRIMYAVFE